VDKIALQGIICCICETEVSPNLARNASKWLKLHVDLLEGKDSNVDVMFAMCLVPNQTKFWPMLNLI